MNRLRRALLRPVPPAGLALAVAALLGACSTADATPTPTPEATPATPTAQPATPRPTPTPGPTPRYSNEPDPDLAALIPAEVPGATLVVAPYGDYGLTPGDLVPAYGDLADRFVSVALAYAGSPRTSLYAMKVEGAAVTTAQLEPHLATAGRYVGIAGLHREPWVTDTVAGNVVWTRDEDNATAAGTHIYTWSSGKYVFLLIGVSDAVNRAIIEQLPGEPAPTPTLVPSPTSSAVPTATP